MHWNRRGAARTPCTHDSARPSRNVIPSRRKEKTHINSPEPPDRQTARPRGRTWNRARRRLVQRTKDEQRGPTLSLFDAVRSCSTFHLILCFRAKFASGHSILRALGRRSPGNGPCVPSSYRIAWRCILATLRRARDYYKLVHCTNGRGPQRSRRVLPRLALLQLFPL